VSVQADNSIFIVTAIPARVIDGELCLDDQTCSGLACWLDQFDRVVLATVSIPEHMVENSTKWQRVSELPFASRLRVINLPWAYSLKDFLKSYSSARRLMREQIGMSQYLCFVPCGMIGDWGSVAAWEALRAGRRYAVLLDRSEARFMRSSLPSLPARRRMKETLMLPLVAAHQHVIVRKSSVGLFQGRDCFNVFSSVCEQPYCVYDVHTRKSDQIDEETCDRKRREVESERRLRVCYAGRATEIKGPMDWLRALHAALESGVNIEAAWLGDGPLLPEMISYARELGIAERVDFVGFVDGAKVLEAVRRSHMFLFCHMTTESPRCLVEALVCGTPLLGYDSVYARDIVAEHGGGVFVPRGRWQQLARMLRELDGDRERLGGLIQAACESGRLFDEETLYGRRATLIKDHLRPAGRSPHDHIGSTA
jgi:glycosyltransferase involved in cell wall biosynthesis